MLLFPRIWIYPEQKGLQGWGKESSKMEIFWVFFFSSFSSKPYTCWNTPLSS